MSLETFNRVTKEAADELRAAADRFEAIAAQAQENARRALEQWEAEMGERIGEDR